MDLLLLSSRRPDDDNPEFDLRDPVEVERRIVEYTARFETMPPEDPVENSDEYEDTMIALLATDWEWTVGQLRAGIDVVFERLLEEEMGYQTMTPF